MDELDKLYSLVGHVAPIYRLSLDFIEFKEEATEEQRALAQEIFDNFDKELERAKTNKFNDLENWYSSSIEYIPVKVTEESEETYLLIGTPEGQAAVANGVVLLREAQDLLLSEEEVNQFKLANLSVVLGRKVYTSDGYQKDVTVTEYRILAINYGKAIAQIQNTYLNLREQINACSSIEELEQVTFSV